RVLPMNQKQDISRKLPSRGGSKSKHQNHYSFELKLTAVKLYLEEGFKQKMICREMGMGTSTFSLWLLSYRRHGEAGLRGALPPSPDDTTEGGDVVQRARDD